MRWTAWKIILLGILINTIENIILLLYSGANFGKNMVISSAIFGLATILFYELLKSKEEK